MDFLLNRYRNLAVLLLAIFLQLILLAFQVKSNGEVRLIRVWAVSVVTPIARGVEGARGGVSHFFSDYFVLLDVREENKRLKQNLDRVSMENQELRTQLATADRAGALALFTRQSPSKYAAAHIVGSTTDPGGKVVFIDRGTSSGVMRGMAVVTPTGIVGKVVNVYGPMSTVLLITDSNFAAGVISQKHRVKGTLKGDGGSIVKVDDVQNEQTVDPDEWFYTSGEDGVFPKGQPAGQVTVVRDSKSRKEIFLNPSGMQNGLEEVLVVIEGVHAPIPDSPLANQPVHLLAPPPDTTPQAPTPTQPGPLSDADRVLEQMRKVGEANGHVFGDRGKGPPNFNIKVSPTSTNPQPNRPPNP